MKPQKILSAGRITLPESFLSRWKLKEGDIILVDELASGLVVLPSDIKPRKEAEKK